MIRVVIIIVLAVAIIGLALYAYQFVAWGNDWQLAFAPAGQALLAGQNPYQVAPFYASPPWGLLVLAPLSIVHPALAMLLPALALLYLAYVRRKPYLIFLVGMSAPMFMCTVYANIDWLVMLGVAIGGPIGAVLDTIKPQGGIMAILAELARRDTWRARALLLLPLAILVLLTAPLWVAWLHSMATVGTNQERSLTSLYPRWLGIVVAIPALWRTWRRKSPIWGCIASLALAPYWQLMSLLPLTYLVADRSWRWGLVMDVVLWIVTFLVIAHIIPLVF